jgi:hypothetical protein
MPSDRVTIDMAEITPKLEASCPAVGSMPDEWKERGATRDEIYTELGQERAEHGQCHRAFRGVVRVIKNQAAGLEASGR